MSADVVGIGKAILFCARPLAYIRKHPGNGAVPRRTCTCAAGAGTTAEPPTIAPAAVAADHARPVETLQQRIADLEMRNAELETFAHTAAHSLRGSLSLTAGFAEILEKNRSTLSDDEVRDILRIIVQNSRKLNNLVDELLLLAGARQQAVKAEPLDMAGIVSEARQRLAPIIEEYGAEVVMPESWPEVLGYAPWIEEVWVNYLSNAIKYGGRPPRVEVGFDTGTNRQTDESASQGLADASCVRFWVRDNGPGIPPDHQRRLFTTFTRLGMIPAAGHGLGLAIVQHIVEKLGGQVGVESNGGGGSLFSFTLPGA